jgi:hypothetical protein
MVARVRLFGFERRAELHREIEKQRVHFTLRSNQFSMQANNPPIFFSRL